MNEKDGFAASLGKVKRLLRVHDRSIALRTREGRRPTEQQLCRRLLRTPLVEPRRNRIAFRQRLAANLANGLPLTLKPLLVALEVRYLADGKRPPFFKRFARDFVELLCWSLYLMPLEGMPSGMRSDQAFNVDTRIPRKRDRDRRARRLRGARSKRARLVEKRRRRSWPAHVELVDHVRFVTGKLFYRVLAELLTAAHRAHGNSGFYLGPRALAKAYRRWLKGSPGGQR